MTAPPVLLLVEDDAGIRDDLQLGFGDKAELQRQVTSLSVSALVRVGGPHRCVTLLSDGLPVAELRFDKRQSQKSAGAALNRSGLQSTASSPARHS